MRVAERLQFAAGHRACVTAILTCSLVLAACNKKSPTAAAPTPPAQQTSAQQLPSPQMTPYEELLAPVALYPDPLLAQVLTSATSPQQVTDMSNWLQQNSQLRGDALQDAANQQGFDASFVALALFPDVLNLMATHIDWTTEVGTAFLSDEKGVMDSVQKLRAKAQSAGNLKTTPQQEVKTEKQGGQSVIIIQPANPQVVYVPQYNPQVVYSPPPPVSSSTAPSDDSAKIVAGLIGFGLGVALGSSMNNNSYYAPYGWGAYGMSWNTRTVVVSGGRWGVPPNGRYPYSRPVPVPYGGYRPRPNVYAPTNININTRPPGYGATRPPAYGAARPPGYGGGTRPPGYAGGGTPRPTPYAQTRPAIPPAGSPSQRPGTTPSTRPATPTAARPGGTQGTPLAGGVTARSGSQPATTARGAAPSSGSGVRDYGSRGYNPSSSQSPNTLQSARGAQAPGTSQAPSAARGTNQRSDSSAFNGYQSGNADRAASQRGRSSVSGSGTRTPAKRR